ncbi:hypothetical protein D3C84_599900 [compost metagenome]
MLISPACSISQTGIRYQGRRITGHRGQRQVIKLGDIAVPKPAMREVILQQLNGETAILDLDIGLGHFVVGASDIQKQCEYAPHDQQADDHGNHQFDETKTGLQALSDGSALLALHFY